MINPAQSRLEISTPDSIGRSLNPLQILRRLAKPRQYHRIVDFPACDSPGSREDNSANDFVPLLLRSNLSTCPWGRLLNMTAQRGNFASAAKPIGVRGRASRADRLPPRDTNTRGTTEIMTKSTLLQMHNIGIVVESLDDAISFFIELGLTLEGRAMIEGEWAGRVTGLGNQRVEIAMMVTPDGHSRLELSRFLVPSVIADHRNAPVYALGYLRDMFEVSDLDEALTRLRKHGAQLVGEVVQYEDSCRLCYIRGPEGLLIGLAESLGKNR